MPPKTKTEALAEVEAYTNYIDHLKSLNTDYDIIWSCYKDQLSRSYPDPLGWYYLTFKPMDKPYETDFEWFKLKQLHKVYDKFRPLCKIMWLTRETEETKIHINLLIYSEHDLTDWHEKIFFNRSKVWCKQIPCIHRFTVFKYIHKEAKIREFKYNLDYKHFDRIV